MFLWFYFVSPIYSWNSFLKSFLFRKKIKILSWNVRGTKMKGFKSQLKEVIKYCNPTVVLLLDTKIYLKETRLLKHLTILIFLNTYWRAFRRAYYYGGPLIIFRFQINTENISWLSTLIYGYPQQHLYKQL